MSLPVDHLERVYAGVLGKVIGVYLGRPVEGWPREKILSDIGHVRYYIHQKFDQPLMFDKGVRPLVVADDDVSATFSFVRALIEHKASDITSEQIGRTWLNNTVEDRSVFWWGGRGISTEHTAYLNLKQGILGGRSGSIETNGKTVAEQIGGEIFVDAFAMCAPGNNDLAARLAKSAASVSHDGEGVYGAVMWAVMEAGAFLSKDVDHLLDTGLMYIPKDSIIARSVADIRAWAKEDKDWETTRDRIEEKYGNQNFTGFCHVVPNHSIKILSLIYGGHSFDEALHIIITCGWDTDSNGGNVGCLLGIMHGLHGIDAGMDWRGPLADRAIISSADGGYSINNCTRIAYDIVNIGRHMAGETPLEDPKEGAQFHFSLPGSVQGFQTPVNPLLPDLVKVEQTETPYGPALGIKLRGLSCGADPVEVMTDTFMPDECINEKHYELTACPIIYPGQKVKALLRADKHSEFDGTVKAVLTIKANPQSDSSARANAPYCYLRAGDEKTIEYTIPDSYDHEPIRSIGLTLTTTNEKPINTTVWLDYIRWTGPPDTIFARPIRVSGWWGGSEAEPWRRAFVNSTSTYHAYMPYFTISKNEGEGGIFQGCRDWRDYKVTAYNFQNHSSGSNGLVARMQGLNRWYALLFKAGKAVLVKAVDEERTELASAPYKWHLDVAYNVVVEVNGGHIKGYINDNLVLEATDGQYSSGAMGMLVTSASATAEMFKVEPIK